MICEEKLFFASPSDGLPIHALLVRPEGEAKGAVLMAHGIGEYKERYLPYMRMLAENGFMAAMNDHRGYGESVRSEDDLGFTYGLGAEGTVKDFETLAEMLSERANGKKMLLYGHSMGTLVALMLLQRNPNRFSGVYLSALPAYNSAAGAGKTYLKLKKRLRGARYRDEAVDQLMNKAYASRFAGEGRFAWLNSDAEKVKEYEADAKCGVLATVDGYLSLLDLMTGAYEKAAYKSINNLLPIHIAVGADDPCADGEKGVLNGEKFLKSVGFVRTAHTVYEGMRHEIHNEPNGLRVMRDALSFFEANC